MLYVFVRDCSAATLHLVSVQVTSSQCLILVLKERASGRGYDGLFEGFDVGDFGTIFRAGSRV